MSDKSNNIVIDVLKDVKNDKSKVCFICEFNNAKYFCFF